MRAAPAPALTATKLSGFSRAGAMHLCEMGYKRARTLSKRTQQRSRHSSGNYSHWTRLSFEDLIQARRLEPSSTHSGAGEEAEASHSRFVHEGEEEESERLRPLNTLLALGASNAKVARDPEDQRSRAAHASTSTLEDAAVGKTHSAEPVYAALYGESQPTTLYARIEPEAATPMTNRRRTTSVATGGAAGFLFDSQRAPKKRSAV